MVAPQGADYSLIEETEQAKRSNEAIISEDKKARAKPKKAKKNSEAMFMGLGDVIFPGMLVLSAMQWLDPSVAFPVAMTTLFGGLMGYRCPHDLRRPWQGASGPPSLERWSDSGLPYRWAHLLGNRNL